MKKVGLIFVLIGFLIFIFYSIYIKITEYKSAIEVYNYLTNTSMETIVKEIDTEYSAQTEKQEPLNIKNSVNYTAILEIPSINLKRGVVDSTTNFESIKYAISVDNNSKYPDEYGNFILYAHSGNSSKAFFKNLYKVEINDEVYVYYNGKKYKYIIDSKTDFIKTGKAKIIKTYTDNYITLISCNQNKKGYQTIFVGKLANIENY